MAGSDPYAGGRPPLRVVHRSDERCSFVRAVYPPGGSYGPHRHETYLLVVLIEGSLELVFPDHVRSVSAGEATLTRPGLVGTYRFSRERLTVHTTCQVKPAVISREERATLDGLTGVFPVSAGVHGIIELALGVPGGSAQFHAAAEDLGRACLRHYAGDCEEQSRAPRRSHPAIVRALDLLRSEAPAIADAADLATRSGISASRLRQLFRSAGYPSPSAALWQAKTERAVRLLRHTGLTLAEIAAQSGFADPFHLSRLIKKATGSSPRELRARRAARE